MRRDGKMGKDIYLTEDTAGKYPLTQAQRGVYFEAVRHPERMNYNLALDMRFSRQVDTGKLQQAVQNIVDAFPVFRTRICEDQGDILQYSDPLMRIEVPVEQLPEEAVQARIEQFVRPFDLEKGPLVRFLLLETPQALWLVQDIHHIISDGTTVTRINKMLDAAYRGEALPEEEVNLYAYAQREQAERQSARYEAAAAYYRERFAGAEASRLPEKLSSKEGNYRLLEFHLDRGPVQRFCEANHFSAIWLFMSAFELVVSRLNRADKVVYTSPYHGRLAADIKSTLGMFVQTIPLLTEIPAEDSVLDFIKGHKEPFFASVNHALYGFSDFSNEMDIKPELTFVYQGNAVTDEQFILGEKVYQNRLVMGKSCIGLETFVYALSDKYMLRIRFTDSQYSDAFVTSFAQAMLHCVENMMADPAAMLRDVSIISAAEEKKLLELGTGEELTYDRAATFVDLFQRQAQLRPQAIAVVDEMNSLTYGELDEKSDALAEELLQSGVQQDSFVAVMLPRRKEFLISTLAVFKAGGAYIPFDDEYPTERLQYMLEDSQARVLITTHSLFAKKSAEESFSVDKIVFLDDFDFSHRCAPVNKSELSALAYMIYTSGSTGRPKGVMVEHRGLQNFIAWLSKLEELRPGDHCAHQISFSFDASVHDLYPPLTAGAELHILSAELRKDMAGMYQYFCDHEIACMALPTQLGMEMLRQYDLPLRYLMLGGERLQPIPLGKVRVYNGYGPTEFTVTSSYHRVEVQDTDNIPIGCAVPNTVSAIVDRTGQLLPCGAAGELCLLGCQMARGYWNLPEKTAAAFVDAPFAPGERMYRTGDLVRWNEEGELEYIGRIDKQVKLRGFRIELGEIESAMNAFPGIEGAVAAVLELNGAQQLCAYYTAAYSIDEAKLQEQLSQSLTAYMVPNIYMRLDRLPLTPNGKVDRRALPVPELKAVEIIAPETEQEKQLFAIAAELLKTRDFGVTTNLLSMGLTSIGAIRLSQAVGQMMGLTLKTKDILQTPSIRQWADCLQSGQEKVRTYERQEVYPLTENQLGVYIDWEQHQDSLQYNVPTAWKFSGIDPERLRAALEKIFAAHPYLKVRFAVRDGQVMQCRSDEAAAEILLERLEREPEPAFFQSRVRPFDLLREKLYRMEIYAAPEHTYLFIDIHHIIYDGGSLGILQQALAAAYTGGALPAEAFSAYDYALFYQEWKESAGFAEAETYFDQLVEGAESVLYPVSQEHSGTAGGSERICLSMPGGAVQEFCRKQGVTANSFFIAMLTQVLHRITREEKLLITTISNGRAAAAMADTMGMFVQTLPVVSRAEKGQTSAGLAQSMHQQLLATIERDKYPFTQLVERHGIKPNILFAYQGGVHDALQLAGQNAAEIPLQLDTAKTPLMLQVQPAGDGYQLAFTYDSSRYAAKDIEALGKALACFVQAAAVNPQQESAALAMIDAAQKQSLLELGMGEPLAFDKSQTIVDLFAAQAKAHPDSVAVVYEERQYTYKEIDELSTRLAVYLQAQGVTRETVVGVMIDRSAWMVIYPLAVMKAGATYMPLDYSFPEDRLHYMLEDAGVSMILSEGDKVESALPGYGGRVIKTAEVLELPDTGSSLALHPAPEDRYVILYTSGSTGRPKGCMLEHHSLANFCHWYVHGFAMTAADRGLVYANFGFDAHMMDIYPTLSCGGTVYIIPTAMRLDLQRIHDYIEKNRITIAFFTTQIGVQLSTSFPNSSLRLMSVGGEKLLPLRKPAYRFFNGYGPTECTIFSTVYEMKADYDTERIGRPLANYQAYVMDSERQLLPRGMAGELYIAGAGVGRGYLNLPEMSADKFAAVQGQRMYRTGDLVRWAEDGNLQYLGRIDKQVKLRGFRIELGEIESVLARFPGIKSAAAAVQELGGVQQLCAYYTAEEAVDAEKLREYAAQFLTAYMVPTLYMQLEKLPLTSNGKVDRRALPVPELKAADIVPPETEPEKKLFRIVAGQLKTEAFGVTTNLISMGLTSIGAIRLSLVIDKELGLTLQTKDILQTPSIQQWTGLLQSGQEEVRTYERQEFYPLTENQLGVYIDWEQHRDSLQYNVPAAWKLSGIDPEQLKAALEKILAAHPYLKVRFAVRDGQIMQCRSDEAAAEILLERLDGEPEPAFFQSRVRPFDLLREKLYRMEIYAAPEHTYLFIDIHHTIYDGGSMGILQRDLAVACGGVEPAPEVFSAYDYALGYQEWKESAAYRDAEAYFNGLVKGAESLLYPVSSGADGCSGSKTVSAVLPKESIQRLCRDQGITVNSFFITALTQVLGRITREEKLLITTISNGRAAAKMADTMGMFVQTLPVVSRTEKGQTVAAALQTMHQQLLETIERDKYPFTQLVEHHGIQPNILFAYQGDVHENMRLGDGIAESLPLSLDTVKMPLAINVLPEGDDYRLLFEYDSSLYTDKDIEILAETVRYFAEEMSEAEPAGEIDRLSLLAESEQQRLLTLGTGEALSYDISETFVGLFKKQAQLRPQATAVVDADSSLTYSALDMASDALAAELLAEGVEQDSFAAVMLPRCKEFLVSTIAVFKAGGAYIPFDDEYPLDRLQYMLEDSQARVLITTHSLWEKKNAEGNFPVENIIFLDDFDFAHRCEPVNKSKPSALAYMIYTSGSTGRPKGVMVEHRGLHNLIAWISRLEELHPGDHCAQQGSFSFDASVPDLYPPLTAGAEIHILSAELRKDMDGMYQYLCAHEIACMTLPTQLGMEMLRQYDLPLRYLMMGGERLQAVPLGKVRVYNGYGPTEFTVASSYHRVESQRDTDNIPIGRAVPNTISAIVDRAGHLLPRGAAGELCLLGCQMARGYWNLPDKTAAVFVDAPFAPGERMYHTGDLVRWNEEGELEYIGRIDKQVKLRGFRIELGEIESVLAGFPGIQDAVAAVQEINGVQQLCAYYTAVGSIDEAMLKGYLAQSLTEYMVPAIYMKLAVLPLTPNGKVDRRALPLPQLDSLFAYVAPSNEIEKKICTVYSKILHREQVGVLDDFFALGGTSLSAMRAIIELSNAGCSISYGTMFQCRTPQAIAALLQDGEAEKQEEAYFNLADYDYTAIQRLLDEPEPDLWNGFELRPYGRILLTGATGYLGIHLLHYLLLHTDSEICCLVREKKGITATRRLYGLLVYYFEDPWEQAFTERVKVILGDITDADLSEKLQGEPIDTVFNCAAIVKHYAANDTMDRVNVDGVRQLIALCERKKALLVQTSTYSIGGNVEEGMGNLLTERNLYIGQQTDNRYILTKFQAERLVLQAAAEGRIQAKVMRMGNLMGRESDGEFQVNMNSNAFAALLKSFKVLGMIPLDRLNTPIEISPIDRSAEAVALLAQTPGGMVVFHTYNNYQVNLAVIVKAFNDYGYPIEVISQERFAAKVSEFMHDPAKAMYMQGLLHNGKGSSRLLHVKADNAYTARILYRLGFYWTPAHGSYMHDFIEMLDGLGFFEEN